MSRHGWRWAGHRGLVWLGALLIALAYLAIVHFLTYLDLRTDREGWDVDLALRRAEDLLVAVRALQLKALVDGEEQRRFGRVVIGGGGGGVSSSLDPGDRRLEVHLRTRARATR